MFTCTKFASTHFPQMVPMALYGSQFCPPPLPKVELALAHQRAAEMPSYNPPLPPLAPSGGKGVSCKSAYGLPRLFPLSRRVPHRFSTNTPWRHTPLWQGQANLPPHAIVSPQRAQRTAREIVERCQEPKLRERSKDLIESKLTQGELRHTKLNRQTGPRTWPEILVNFGHAGRVLNLDAARHEIPTDFAIPSGASVGRDFTHGAATHMDCQAATVIGFSSQRPRNSCGTNIVSREAKVHGWRDGESPRPGIEPGSSA